MTRYFLIDERLALVNLSFGGSQYQVAGGIDSGVGDHSVIAHYNRSRIGAGSDLEIVFKLSQAIAVVSEINSGVDVPILHPGKGGNVSLPLAAILAGSVIDAA